MAAEGLCLTRIFAVFERILVADRRARSFSSAMHAAAFLAADGWSLAKRALARRRAAAWALSHGPYIAWMRPGHLCTLRFVFA